MVLTLMVTTISGMACSSWLMVWMLLEANTLAMCFLVSHESKTSMKSEKATMTYFMVQILASILILLASSTEQNMLSSTLIMGGILAKMGVWPAHLWYMKMINLLQMKQNSLLILMTWQKILPAFLAMSMSKNMESETPLMMVALVSLVTPLTMLKSNLTTKSIMALSSLNNNAWLVMAISLSTKSFTAFLALYSSTLMMLLKTMNWLTKKSESTGKSFWYSMVMFGNLGGLPPLTMFWMKVMILKTLMESNTSTEICGILMLSACIMLYHYLWTVTNESTASPVKSQNQAILNKKESKTYITMILPMSFVSAYLTMIM
uniref:NADH-ubiquinone oxidoreductase chain 2 n=1 Tax=Aleuroglyphus ovatus TaxID=212130 RepID=A0A023HK95_ALEOV|nr:NADH dehydrogenase subunit 2 [Aleuroglyphus ovatus]AGM14595.1 NADH dehydrogenase subunit 2 [Aleuroglyphus ovatus]AID52420.1 NADH dehydrogenase subunit 2 [Aleuroglyphus ovatus]QWW33393.1 NADH dehydrogenase subunit 2 [Aleuroglyphus ovatus]